ncbi:MAG: dockerin type I domain-containing protein, partial [Candidatus Falkowbacteria bacterium]|nr:dockerin type I domain-containing protein [Candidatus Falkowbacteria bacterium]
SAELIISNSISTNKNTATTTIIEIEDPTTLTKTTVLTTKGDTNSDNKINLIDFSIVAYWYGRSSPPPSADLNHDGKVNLIDLSIMAYNWTG